MPSWIACCFRGGSAIGKLPIADTAPPFAPTAQDGSELVAQELVREVHTANGQAVAGEPAAAPSHLPPLPHQATKSRWDAVALEATPHAVTVVALGGACPGAVLYQNALSRSYFGNRCAAYPAAAGAAGSSASARPAAAGAHLVQPLRPDAAGTLPTAPSGSEECEDGSDPALVLPPVLFDLFSLCPEKLHALAHELMLEPAAAQGTGGGGKCWKSVIRVPTSCEAAPPLGEAGDDAVRPVSSGAPATRQQPALSLHPWASGGRDPTAQQQAAEGTPQRQSPSNSIFSTDAALRQAPSFPLLTPPQQAHGGPLQPPFGSSKAAAQPVADAASVVPGPNGSAATATTGAPSTPSRHSAPLGHVPFSTSSGHLVALPSPQHHTQGKSGRMLHPSDVRHPQQQHQQRQQQQQLQQQQQQQLQQQHRFSLQLPAQPAQALPVDQLPVQLLPAGGSRHTGSSSGLPHRHHSQQGYSSQHVSGTGVAMAHVSGALTAGGMVGTGGHAALNSTSASALSNALATSTIALAIEQQPGLASAIAHSLPMGTRTGAQQARAVTSASGMLVSGFSGPIAAASLDMSQPLLLVGQPWEEHAPPDMARARLLLPASGSGDEVGSSGITGENVSGSGREALAGGRGGSAGAVGKARALPQSPERGGPVATPRGSLVGIPELGSFQLEERSGADGGRPAGGGIEGGDLGRQGGAPDDDRFHKWLKFMMKGPLPDKSRGQFTRPPHQIHRSHQQPPQQPQQQAVPRQVSGPFALWPSGSGGALDMLSSGRLPQARPLSWQGRDAAGSSGAFQLPAPVVPRRSMTVGRGEVPTWDGAAPAGSRVNSRAASAVSSQWGDLSTHSFTAQQVPAAGPPAGYSGSPSCPLPRMPALQQTNAATTAAQPSTAADVVERSHQLLNSRPDRSDQHQHQQQEHTVHHDRAARASCSALGEVGAAAVDSGSGYGCSGRGSAGGSGGAGGGRGRRGGSVGGGRVSGSDVALVRQALAPRMAAVRGRRGSSLAAASASQVAISRIPGSDVHDGAASSSITGELSNLTSECAVPESELSMRSSSKFSQLQLPVRGGRSGGAHASNASRSSHGGSWDAYSSTQDLNTKNFGEPSRTRRVSEAAAVGGSGWRPFVDMVPEAEATVSMPAEEVEGVCEARGAAGGGQLLLIDELAAGQQPRGGSSSITLSADSAQTAAVAVAAAAARGAVDAAHALAATLPSSALASQVASAAGPPTLMREALPGPAEALAAVAVSDAAAKANAPTVDATATAAATTTAMLEAVATAAASAVTGAAPSAHMRLEHVHLQSLLSQLAPGTGHKSSSSGGIYSAQGEPSLAVPSFTPADEALLTAALRSAGGRSTGASSVTGYAEVSRPDAADAADSARVTRLRVAGGSLGGRLELMDRTSNGSGTGSGATGPGCPSSLFCATLNQFPSGAVGAAGMSTSGAVGASISGSGPQRNRLLASAMTTLDLSVPQQPHTGTKPAAQGRLRALRLRGGSGDGSASGESSQPGTPGLMSPLLMDSRRRPLAEPFAGELEPPVLASEPEAVLQLPPSTAGCVVSSPDPSVQSCRPATASGFLGGMQQQQQQQQQQGARAGSQVLLDGITAASNTASVASTAFGVGPNELLLPVSFDIITQQGVRLQQQVSTGAAPAASHLAVLGAASGADPSGGFVYGPGLQGAVSVVSVALSTAASGLGGCGATYHRIMATVQPEPSTGGQVLVLMQTDVSAKVAAESHAILVAETQHRLLEQIYPQHVLAALMEQLVAQQAQVTQALQDAREAAVTAEAAAVRAAAAWSQLGVGHPHAQQAPLFLSGQQAYASGAFVNNGTLDALEAHYSGISVPCTASERAASRTCGTEVGAVPTSRKDAAADAAEDAAAAVEAAAAALRRLERRAGQTVQNPPAFTGHGDLARFHPQVSVLFADIKGFTALCKDIDPEAVMRMLNDLFSRFDNLLDRFGLRKMDTIGDGYVAAGGLTHAESSDASGQAVDAAAADMEETSTRPNVALAATASGEGARSAEEVALPSCPSFTTQLSPRQAAHAVFKFAQAMLRAADQVSLPTTGQPVQIRIGIATGPVVSGVVGATKPKYSLFGDTVHAASRLESAGEAGAIHVSSATYALLVGDTSSGPHQQSQTPCEQLLQPMDGGRWSRTAAGMQLRSRGPAEATFIWTPGA